MTGEERAIWRAAYGSAFAHDFFQAATIQNFDRANETVSPEWARAVADIAVRKLRDWRRYEEPECGRRT